MSKELWAVDFETVGTLFKTKQQGTVYVEAKDKKEAKKRGVKKVRRFYLDSSIKIVRVTKVRGAIII